MAVKKAKSKEELYLEDKKKAEKKKKDREFEEELAKIFIRTERSKAKKLVPSWSDLSVRQKSLSITSWVVFLSALAFEILVLIAAYTGMGTSGSEFWLTMAHVAKINISKSEFIYAEEPWFRLIQSFYFLLIIYGCGKVIRTILSLVFVKSNNKTITIIRLINSIIRYVSAFIIIFVILAVWGVNLATILASAGILALIIGLGAQTLIADIIGGIGIVFEEQFDVGDTIVIDGFRGVVYEIGLATTKVVDASGNKKSIRNSQIVTVINQSHDLSLAMCDIDVDYSTDLASLRNLIEEQVLPALSRDIPAIVGEARYLGVNSMKDSGINLRIIAKCEEEDRFSTQRAMNEIVLTIFKKNGVKIPFPQIVVSKREEE